MSANSDGKTAVQDDASKIILKDRIKKFIPRPVLGFLKQAATYIAIRYLWRAITKLFDHS
jgi:hypothetical protein